MPDEAKQITAGEALQVGGITMIKIGEALEDDQKITIGEWMQIAQAAAEAAWNEYND